MSTKVEIEKIINRLKKETGFDIDFQNQPQQIFNLTDRGSITAYAILNEYFENYSFSEIYKIIKLMEKILPLLKDFDLDEALGTLEYLGAYAAHIKG